MNKEMLCPDCGERRMWQTTIRFNPYSITTGWHCRVCEQKAAPKGGACSKHIRADDFDTNDSPEILIPLSREE